MRAVFAGLAIAVGAACGSYGVDNEAPVSGVDAGTDASAIGAEASVDGAGPAEGAPPFQGCDGGPAPDLVGYWPLDEGTGTVAHDCSGHAHDGHFVGAALNGGWTAGKKGGGYEFDGTSGCIDLGTPADLALEATPFTVAAWVSIASFVVSSNLTRYIAGRTREGDTIGWRIATGTNDRINAGVVGVDSSTSTVFSATNMPAGVWTHVAVVYVPGTTLTMYVNGSKADEKPAPAQVKPDTPSRVMLGCRGDESRYFDGMLDEVRIYRRALTTNEIARLAGR
jgi:hypothetical protein